MYIEMNNVTKTIKNKLVLDNVSLALPQGQIHGLIGANGSGKTMLFRALCGFLKLDSGTVSIDGHAVQFNESLPVDIGLILETPGFIDNETVIQNLKYLANIKGNYNEVQLAPLLDAFNITQYRDKKVKSLSLGNRQKVGIVQAIMENQSLLILDEPTNGLDKASVQVFIDQMNILKAAGKTILLASHNEYEMLQLADTITEIADGKIVHPTTPVQH